MTQKKNFFRVVIGLLIMLTPVLAFGQFRVENETRSNLNILFENPDYEIKQEMIGAAEYDYISTQVQTVTVEVGAPELPFYSSTIEIPNTGKPTINIRIIESEIIKDVNIKPFRENELQSLTFDNTLYTKNVFYPTTIAQIGEPAILRNKRLVNFIVNPFRYNDSTNSLEVIKKAEIEITFENEPSVNEITRSFMKADVNFENFFSSVLLNYKEPTSRDDYQNPTILYIYPAALANNPVMENLFNWRREQGWTVYTASTTLTGTSTTSIKAYIQDAYDTWENAPTYVTLIGDGSGSFSLPVYQLSSSYTPGGDHWYTLLEGNDELEDIFIGRISIDDMIDLSTIVTKTIKYEKASVIPDSTYYTRALLVGDTSPSGQSTIITNLYVKEIMNDYNDDYTFIEHYGDSPAPSQVSSGMNAGVGFWNYRGWIGMDGWGTGQAAALTNVNKLTVCVILTCSTGTFYSGESVTEAVVRSGSASSPTGGVCSIGLATSGTHTTFNNCLNGGIMGYLFQEDGWTMGAANNRGKFHLWEAYGISKPERVQFFSTICNLIGDSALRVYKEQPKSFDTEYIENIAAGTNQYKVSTTLDGLAFSHVWATLKIGEDYYTGYTNSYGEIFFNIAEDSTGDGTLTLTKEGYQPQQYDVNFGLEAPVLNATAITLYNEGTEVEFVSPGKSYALKVEATNNGSADVTNISASITASTNGVIVTEGNASYGNIVQSASVENTDNFEFSVENRAYESDIAMNIVLSNSSYSWERQIILPVHSPIIQVSEYDLANTGFGPGETSVISVDLMNNGDGALVMADATLSTTDNRVTINSADALLGSLVSGATGTVSFNITASNDLLPGDLVPMIVTIDDDGFETESYFSLQVGVASVTDPLGPDAYGYYIFDSYDTEYAECPVYDWVELDPSEGGVGTIIPLPDNGDNQEKVATIDLPFTFRFYDVDYDQISICSNGWLAMGETEQATFRNWRLPGPLGASPMIAPFWDDLLTGSTGQVFVAHDQAENYFVITWNEWRNHYSTSYEETFQVILYDPEYYASSTGDAPIKIQYKVVNNVDNASGNSHGEYSTVGIEDHTGTVGLEYTYNNSYPQAARPLENEMALFITTKIGQLPPFVMTQPNDVTFEEDYSDNTIDLYSIFKDPNNDVLEFSFSESDNLNLEFDENGYLVITPNQNWNGTETVTIYAEDGVTDFVVSVSFLVTVTPVNDRPSLQSKFPVDTNFDSNTNILTFSVVVNDVDSELAYEWKIDNEIVEGEVSDTLNFVFDSVGEYTVKCYASDSDFTVIATWNVNIAVSNDINVVAVNNLSQNNPNPFNPTTNINFSLSKNSNVSIIVYNVKGQKVKTLVSDRYTQGSHNVVWNGLDDNNQPVASGVYFYRMVSDEFHSTKKAIMMK